MALLVSIGRHRQVRRVRAGEKGRIRRLCPPGRRDGPHCNPADQPDQHDQAQIGSPAPANVARERYQATVSMTLFTPRRALHPRHHTQMLCMPHMRPRMAASDRLGASTPLAGQMGRMGARCRWPRVSDAIAWAHELIERCEGGDAPPTALTISRENPWRWRDLNRGSRICKSARQRHRFESTCHFGETERYSLVLVGTHWHSLVRAARVLFVSHRGRAFRIRLCSARKSHRGCPIPALIYSPIEGCLRCSQRVLFAASWTCYRQWCAQRI